MALVPPTSHAVLQANLSMDICHWLAPNDLAAAELAGCDRTAVAACWEALQKNMAEEFTSRWWFARPATELPTNPKAFLRSLEEMKRSLSDFPESWEPCIHRIAGNALEINPRSPDAVMGGSHHGGTEDYIGMYSRPSSDDPTPPRLAAVPLAVSCARGSSIAATIRLGCTRLDVVGEAFALGAEFSGTEGGYGSIVTTAFSPVSGRVFVRFPGEQDGLQAQLLPPLEATTSEPATSWEEMEVIVLISARGGVTFGRRRLAAAGFCGFEWAGELPPDFFPPWAQELFVSLNFQVDQLNEPMRVASQWVSAELPAEVPRPPAGQIADAVWGDHMW